MQNPTKKQKAAALAKAPLPNTSHKRWLYGVIVSPFASAIAVKLAERYVPESVPFVPAALDALAGLL